MGQDTLLSVTEFAELAGTQASKLRYYDDIGLLEPFERDSMGKRYYSPMQLATLSAIGSLSNFNMSLEEIASWMPERNPDTIYDLLQQQDSAMDDQLTQMLETHRVIRAFSELLSEARTVDDNSIKDVAMIERQFLLGPQNTFDDGDSFFESFTRSWKKMRALGFYANFPIGGYFNSMEHFEDNPAQPDRYISLNPRGTAIRPAGRYLVGYARGYYGEPGDLPKRMIRYANKNNLVLDGPVYNVFLEDELSKANPHDYLLQASIKIQTTKSSI
ncbi:MAG: MerR family transcriptional regulator [Coriobacteriales bacterium]|jgi:DNA-binding transcriptional MerR regulator|nr:MerR family transcriptional regulator [Coriobacteriales bacterium]